MKCHLFRLLIQQYYDGELDPAECAEYENHRRQCAACRARDSRFALCVQALDDVPRLEPSADFNRRVLSQVDVASYRVSPAAAALRAIGRTWNGMPVALRNSGIIAAICAVFIAVYKPLLDYMIVTIRQGAEALWSATLLVRELGGRIAPLLRSNGAARSYEVVGQTLLRAFHHMVSGVNPVQVIVAISSLVLIAVVLRRTLEAARRKGENNVCIL
jgi:hypothetical protein